MQEIRLATPEDAPELHSIYAPFVRDTAISFEWDVPSVDQIRGRIEKVLESGYPWLVSVTPDGIDGYAYATSFRTRIAYSWSAEVSVYVRPEHHRRGVGRSLYAALLRLLALQGYRSVYGVATTPNPSSEALHRGTGFKQVGYLPRVGYKLGSWHDVILWLLELESDRPLSTPRRIQEVLKPGDRL